MTFVFFDIFSAVDRQFPRVRSIGKRLAELYKAETSLVFNSGYHTNSGILPAVTDNRSLILADKLVHASIVDGIGLSKARCIRYRHNDYEQWNGWFPSRPRNTKRYSS